MTDLLTALQSAERGSRELDALIEKTLGLAITTDRTGLAMAGDGTRYRVPHYTTSLDAAQAFVERVCRGIQGNVSFGEPGPQIAVLWRVGADKKPYVLAEEQGATPPLALVIALVKTKEAVS